MPNSNCHAFCGVQLAQVAADLSWSGEFEQQRRFVGTARVAVDLHRRHHFPNKSQFRCEGKIVDAVAAVAVGKKLIVDRSPGVLESAAADQSEGRCRVELFFEVDADVGGVIELVFGLGAVTAAAGVVEIQVELAGAGVLKSQSEAVAVIEERRGQNVAQLGAPVVVPLRNNREVQRVFQVRVVVVCGPFERLGRRKRRSYGHAVAHVVVIVALVGVEGERVGDFAAAGFV